MPNQNAKPAQPARRNSPRPTEYAMSATATRGPASTPAGAVGNSDTTSKPALRPVRIRKNEIREGWCRVCNEREAEETYLVCGSCRFDEAVREYSRDMVWCEECQIGVNDNQGHRYGCPERE